MRQRRLLQVLLLVLLVLLTTLLLHAHWRAAPTEQLYGHTLQLFRDGSQHPLTSYLDRKLKTEYLFGRQLLSPGQDPWTWQPRVVRDRTSQLSTFLSLTVQPALLPNGGVATVRWDGSGSEVSLDVLALYCPPDAPLQRFIDFWWLKRGDLHCPTCTGKTGGVRLALYNVREACQFRLLSAAPGSHQSDLLAVSNRVEFVGGSHAPLHAHLALTSNPTQMRVQWTSGVADAPLVMYGQSPTDLSRAARGVWRTYTSDDLCGPPANLSGHFLNPGFLHDVLLSGLEPDTRYFYKYGDGGRGQGSKLGRGQGSRFSGVKSFTTPLPHGSGKTFRFAVYGDMDVTAQPGAELTAELLLTEAREKGFSFVLHIGDLSYAEGLAYRWEEWMSLIEPYASLVPYMVSIGNHDQVTASGSERDPSGNSSVYRAGSYHDSQGECGVPSDKRFHMPDNGNRLWWYSFRYASVHLIQLSSEHSTSPGSPQYRWLQHTLQHSVDRHLTPWLIVTAHRPLYLSEDYKDDLKAGERLRSDLEDLLSQHKVDLFIAGHNHAYERTCKVYRSKCGLAEGVVHIVVGTAGMDLDQAELLSVEWSERVEFSFGYGRVTVNRTDLLWEFVRNVDQHVSDSLHLRK